MMNRFAIVRTRTSADVTIGKSAFLSVLASGSAADSTITILDDTAIKYVITVGSTVANLVFDVPWPVAFRNMIVDLTGTASYSITYIPTT